MPARLTAIARDDLHQAQGPRASDAAQRAATSAAAPTFMTAGGQLLVVFSGALLAGGDLTLRGYGLTGVALGFALLLQGHRALTRRASDQGAQR